MKRAVYLIFAFAILLFSCSCGSKTDSHKENDNQQLLDEESVSEENKNKNSVGFDGTVSGEFFDISIESSKWTDSLESPLITVTPEGTEAKLLFLVFSAKNKTEETYNLGMFNAYVDEQAVLPTSVAGEIDGAMPFVGAVAGGMQMKAYYVWELPENWEEFQLNYFEATGPECKQYFVIHREDIA